MSIKLKSLGLLFLFTYYLYRLYNDKIFIVPIGYKYIMSLCKTYYNL